MKTILDVSNIVYGGYYGSPNYRISGFPIGGIRKVFGILNAEIAVSDFILCFDGGIKFRKELAPQYKAGRVPNYAVMAQLDLLKEMLTECNIPYAFSPDYEADDLICSSVYFCNRVGDPDNIVIYSDDRDLACCVSPKVTLRHGTTNGTTIKYDTYERHVVSGENIPYNTILLYKMIHGDKSDNYSGLRIPGLRFIDFAMEYVRQLQPLIESGQFPESSYMDIDVVNIIIDNLPGSINEESRAALKKQAQIAFPRLKDISYHGIDAFFKDLMDSRDPIYAVERRHLPVFGQNTYNRRQFTMYCNVLGLNRCKMERYSSGLENLAENFRTQLKLRAKELSSGVMAVERYKNKQVPPANVSALENMELPI